MEHGLLILGRQYVLPGRHGCAWFSLGDRAEQLAIRFGRGRGGDEIAWSRGKKRGLGPVTLAGRAMALHAMLAIDGLTEVERFGRLGEQDACSTDGQEEREKEVMRHRPNHGWLRRCRSLQNLAAEVRTIILG